jgi:hypothetical protein
MYSASAQDSIYLVSHTIPDTVTYNTWFEHQVTYASTNINDTSIDLRVWNTIYDPLLVGGPETKNLLKIKKISSKIQNNKFYITFVMYEVAVDIFMGAVQNLDNTWQLEASTKILTSKRSNIKFFVKSIDNLKAPSGSITNIFKTMLPNEATAGVLLVPTFKRYLIDLSKGFYDPFQDTTARDTTRWYTKDTTYTYDIIHDTIDYTKCDTTITPKVISVCDTIKDPDLGIILEINCHDEPTGEYDTSIFCYPAQKITSDTINTNINIQTIEHIKVDYAIKQNITYKINYGQSGEELLPTGSIIRILNDSILEVYGEEFKGTDRTISGYLTAYNQYGGVTEPLTINFIVDLQAYLDGVAFKATAIPGEEWQARFSYADTIKTATDTIIKGNFTIPDWTTLKDTSYMAYYWKNVPLKSGNYLKAMVRDSIFVKTFIVAGTVPTSILKSTLVSYDIVASVCRYDNTCTTPKTYTLTVTDTVTNIKINEDREQAIDFYPNPAQSVITLKGDIQMVKIYDLLGNQKLMIKPQGSEEINISHLPVGVYVIELSGSSSTVTKKLMKE